MSPSRELYRLTMDVENDDTDRRIAEFRRNLQTYEDMSNHNNQNNSTSDPDSGYRTATPEPAKTPEPVAFVANPESPHLAPSPRLHPNVTTRAQKRRGRRFSDLFTIGRNTPTPTFDRENRPKISRPIVDQGEIDVPNNGPYIYNHPSRPRLDVEIPRSSFSDLWGQRYGPIGDEGYNVDGVQHEVRNTQSVDFGRLLGGRQNYRHDTRRHGVSLGGIDDWTALVTADSTTDLAVSSEHGEDAEADDMDASYLAPLVSPTLQSSSSSITTSASLPSISNLPPLPFSTSDLPPLPPSPVALEDVVNPVAAPAADHNHAPSPGVDLVRAPSPLPREQSERWTTRHPLRQNPPTRHFVPPAIPPPPPPPSSPIHFPPSTPSPATHWPTSLQHFRPSCGVLISNLGSMAMVQPFLVSGDREDGERDFEGSFVESSASSMVRVRDDTPSPEPQSVQRRLFGSAGIAGAAGTGSSTAQPLQQRRASGALRSLCCGLFSSRRRHTGNSSVTSHSPPRQPLHPMTQRQAPSAHSTIEQDEELNDQENVPPAIFEHQTRTIIGTQPPTIRSQPPANNYNQHPTIVEHLVDNEEHDEHNTGHDSHGHRGNAEQETTEQEMVDELNVRRSSVRHSWVTVSRWLE